MTNFVFTPTQYSQNLQYDKFCIYTHPVFSKFTIWQILYLHPPSILKIWHFYMTITQVMINTGGEKILRTTLAKMRICDNSLVNAILHNKRL